MSIEGQGHFFTIYFPGFVCFVLYLAKISGERLQDHWSSGFILSIFAPPTPQKMHLPPSILMTFPMELEYPENIKNSLNGIYYRFSEKYG